MRTGQFCVEMVWQTQRIIVHTNEDNFNDDCYSITQPSFSRLYESVTYYYAINCAMANKHTLETWNNIETFSLRLFIVFPVMEADNTTLEWTDTWEAIVLPCDA